MMGVKEHRHTVQCGRRNPENYLQHFQSFGLALTMMREGTKYRKEYRHTLSFRPIKVYQQQKKNLCNALLLLLSSLSFFRVTEHITLIVSLLCSTQPRLKP